MAFTIDLKEKVVLVTGVSSGIGLGVAREFARAGADVAGCSRKAANDESIVTYVEAVESEGSRGLYVQADVTKEQDLEQLVRKVIDTFGRLDILVSNAGMNVFEGAEHCDEEHWRYNLDLNLASHWRLAKLLQALFETNERGGYFANDFKPCVLYNSWMFSLQCHEDGYNGLSTQLGYRMGT